MGSDLINRSVKDALCVTGGCGVGVLFFGATFFTAGGLATVFGLIGLGLIGFGFTGAALLGVGFFVTWGVG